MTAIAAQGSPLPGGFILGKLSHAERVGLVYEALPGDGHGFRARALVLHPQHAEALQTWFEDYARLIRGLSHPNLLYVHAIGYVDSGLPVIVTEWIEGRTLRSELARGHIFQPAEILRILRPLASALDYLHNKAHPVLHRALQPEQVVLIGSELSVKLLGVGEADRPLQPPLRPQYLSPEELDGQSPTPASDLFGLATLAYEIITGRLAFPGPPAALLHAVRKGPRPYLALGPNEALSPVDAVLHRAWEADPGLRPPSAASFYVALAAAIERVPPAELTRRRTPLDSPFRARTVPGASTTARPESAPRSLSPSGRPPSIPATRSGQYPAVRSLSPGPMAAMGWANGAPGPTSSPARNDSGRPPGPNAQHPSGQRPTPRVPRAQRTSSPEGALALPPAPPTDLPVPVLRSGRPPVFAPTVDAIQTEDAELSMLRVVDIEDQEVSSAVYADPDLPLPVPVPDGPHDEDERPTLVRTVTDDTPLGKVLQASLDADEERPHPALPDERPHPARTSPSTRPPPSVRPPAAAPVRSAAAPATRPAPRGAPAVHPAPLPGTERTSFEAWGPTERADRSGPTAPQPAGVLPPGPREIRITVGQLALLIFSQVLLTLLALALFKWVV